MLDRMRCERVAPFPVGKDCRTSSEAFIEAWDRNLIRAIYATESTGSAVKVQCICGGGVCGQVNSHTTYMQWNFNLVIAMQFLENCDCKLH